MIDYSIEDFHDTTLKELLCLENKLSNLDNKKIGKLDLMKCYAIHPDEIKCVHVDFRKLICIHSLFGIPLLDSSMFSTSNTTIFSLFFFYEFDLQNQVCPNVWFTNRYIIDFTVFSTRWTET